MRSFLTLLFVAFYLVGVFPSAAASSKQAVKVKVTHTHSHDEGHSHHQHDSTAKHEHSSESTHSHEVFVVGCAVGHIMASPFKVVLPLEDVSHLTIPNAQPQFGIRLSAIFRPPIA